MTHRLERMEPCVMNLILWFFVSSVYYGMWEAVGDRDVCPAITTRGFLQPEAGVGGAKHFT